MPFYRIIMADDFDVEAMLEAPYRKVGCGQHGLWNCYDLLWSPYNCYSDKVYLNVVWCVIEYLKRNTEL